MIFAAVHESGVGQHFGHADMAAQVSLSGGLVGVAVHLGLPQADIATLVCECLQPRLCVHGKGDEEGRTAADL